VTDIGNVIKKEATLTRFKTQQEEDYSR